MAAENPLMSRDAETADSPMERVAVLIDCDSSEAWSGRALDLLMLEIAQFGQAIVRRGFGDFSESRKWRRSLLDHAFTPVLEYTPSSKTSMIIDAMDLLFDRDIDAFVIVSSSAALARLAMRIRESNRVVIGYGDRSASRDLVVACHRFVYRDNLGMDLEQADVCDVDDAFSSEPSSEKTPIVASGGRARLKCVSGAQLRKNKLLIEMLLKAVRDNSAETGGWAYLSTVGHEILRILPDFDARDWGYTKLGDLLRATELFDFGKPEDTTKKHIVQIRVKDDVPFSSPSRSSSSSQQREVLKRQSPSTSKDEDSSTLQQILDEAIARIDAANDDDSEPRRALV